MDVFVYGIQYIIIWHLKFKNEKVVEIIENNICSFYFEGRIRALAISNNDKYFASAANNIHIRLYETRTGSLLHLLEGRKF